MPLFWSITLAVLAVLLAGLLLLLYLRGAFRRRPNYRLSNLPDPTSARFLPVIASLSDSLQSSGAVTQVWLKAEEIFAARLDAIAAAQRIIQFETYIMTPGQRAEDFAEALIRQAQAGIKVQFVADSYGVRKMPSAYWQYLRRGGIEVHLFNPPSWRSPIDYLRRSHCKLLLIDQQQALIGGAGVSDMWDGAGVGDGTPWFDFEVRLQGDVVSTLHGFFIQHWLDAGGAADFASSGTPAPDLTHDLPQSGPILITTGEYPSYRNSPIRALFEMWVLAAQQRVWIASPYLLPDENLRKSLSQAVQRGVDVRILTMGAINDKPYIRWVSQLRYPDLLARGVALHEYQPSMLHAKMLLVDDAWISLGSANVDPRSFYQNDELNFASPEPDLVKRMEAFFEQGFANSKPVTRQSLKQRPLKNKVLGHLVRLAYWQL
ncbi:phosphatidylserine/phosphatidylglycerophosphate/cardiolipin synthase family protein [Romeria aff. gracilis LEGE 07310]|uniref:Phosphatidylserine/phosphatidylglycerophosphate/ cardiolipin synthase family protein n=1 Tax=Vasconcelosia minhoensis LEGE 07310 TaxID=915328 RepID=A0A8J7A5G9_9CYAN|nr:phosphatidylserine/phosphatidylglycerophosphate/cardiolipin synthase family protein [Romeria gracilis]MBE9076345.1 phosphatidylserine/phosphatidylglycerophosphate/cardiolipin synthase family protein [Romeria aff. gracilis LEGE 07310]